MGIEYPRSFRISLLRHNVKMWPENERFHPAIRGALWRRNKLDLFTCGLNQLKRMKDQHCPKKYISMPWIRPVLWCMAVYILLNAAMPLKNSSCVANIWGISTKPTKLCWQSSPLLNEPNFISLPQLYLELAYLFILFILQLACCASQLKNK